MKKIIAQSLLIGSASLTGTNSFAEIITNRNAEEVPSIVVSASRMEQSFHEVGSSIVVLDADELIERGISFIGDAFREVPSLNMITQGPRGSMNQLRIRGNEANHVLVLVDGVRVSSAATGEFDFANMHLAGIDRIEVLLGPQSTLYGSDAAAGVINIISRKGSEGFTGESELSIDSLDSQSGSVYLSGGKEGWHYAVTTSRFITEGISAADEDNGNTEKDAHDSSDIKIKTGYDAEKYKTWLVYNKNKSDYEFDGDDFFTGLAVDALDHTQTIETENASWIISAPILNNRLDNRLQISNTQYDYSSYSYGSDYLTQTDRSSIEYQGNYKLNDNHYLHFGAEHVQDDLLVEGFSTFDRDTSITGTYLQWSGKFASTDITLGMRSDNHDEFGRHNTYRATASHQLNKHWRLRAAIGTGFKAPSLQELYDIGSGGNPDLKPEESESTELGIEYTNNAYSASATVFDQDTTNLIRYVGSFPTGILENVDDADSRGVELNLGYLWPQAELTTAISWIDATETVAGIESQRYRIPEWSANIIASYFITRGRAWAEAQYQDDRRDLNWALSQDVTLDAYWLFNLGLSLDLSKEIKLTARIDNLLDENYEEIFSYGTRGRTSTISLNWRF